MTSSEKNNKPVANPLIVCREESDKWAMLFDPDTGEVFSIDPVGVCIWKLLDGKHNADEISCEIKEAFTDVPEDAGKHVEEFIKNLINRGLAGQEVITK